MSIYKELNDVQLDISEFEEKSLSESERKRIIKNVQKKIRPYQRKNNWTWAGIAVVAACVIGATTLTLDKGTIASMPFVAEPIEKYINELQPSDFSSYKTAIGETAENGLGKLTLNEVMMDDQQLYFSATFQPAEGVEFDYQTNIFPTVKINGEDYTVSSGGQSIELNDSMFTIYNDIDLRQSIDSEELNIEISYDKWEYDTFIDQPWTFDVNVSQKNLLEQKRVFTLNKEVTLNNGEIVTIEKVVSTPISTAIYYDLTRSSTEDIYFSIKSADGTEVNGGSSFVSNEPGEVSTIRINGLSMNDEKYFLVAHNSEDVVLSDPIPIN
ncbi:hypothetical protein JOC95_001181 [Bacillus tianshenii]|uniref:DUF4179 domain-containing protein n=1 Tax=Sutcliffiella tianshenii TaxID=1463404 RepID=A0ABS2NXE2_9BACI|nr:DUF4179 domain-containing protein [Bacillus tianshenii]MBM7619332.1 hypothetical protein [Bacillus tianshenii]